MKHYEENFPSVLSREADNKHHIYLYPRYNGRVWTAYGQSAHNLHLLMPHIRILQQKIEGIPQPLDTLVVPQLSLEFLLEKGVDIWACDKGRNLKLTLPKDVRKSNAQKVESCFHEQ